MLPFWENPGSTTLARQNHQPNMNGLGVADVLDLALHLCHLGCTMCCGLYGTVALVGTVDIYLRNGLILGPDLIRSSTTSSRSSTTAGDRSLELGFALALAASEVPGFGVPDIN